MARALQSTIDPSQNAGATLRRLGFAILMLVVPILPFVARRGIVVFVPIGIGALVLAALIDGRALNLREGLRRLIPSYGKKLAEDAGLLHAVRQRTSAVLQLHV